MDKYTLLFLLNLPFVIFGYIKAVTMYQEKILRPLAFVSRLIFWTLILGGLVFAKSIFLFLFVHNLTDSAPLSLADVVLVTGVIFGLFLSMRLYTKVDLLERQVTSLHEKLSTVMSKNNIDV